MRPLYDNVGRIDAFLRVLLMLGTLALLVLGLRTLDSDWYPTILPGLGILAGYLLMTAGLHWDPLYVILQVNTVKKSRRREQRREPRVVRSS